MTTTINQPAPIAESTGPDTTFSLFQGEPPGPGLVRIMVEQIDVAAWHLQHVQESDAHIHEVRKSTKRFRAVLRMARDDLGPDTYGEMNTTVRDVARELSHARSAVVQITVLEGLVDRDAALASTVDPLRNELLLEAEASRAALETARIADLSRRLDTVRDLIGNIGTAPGRTALRSGIERTYRKGRKAMRLAYAGTSPEEFHIWRKQVKYLRHQMEVLDGIGHEVVEDLIVDLEGIGEALGADNDLADLERTASTGDAWKARDELLRVIASDRAALEDGLRSQADQVYAERPTVFADRIAHAWA